MVPESKSLVFTRLSWIAIPCEPANSLLPVLSTVPQTWTKPRTSLINKAQCIHLMEFYSVVIENWAMIIQSHMEEIKIYIPNEIGQSLDYEPRMWWYTKMWWFWNAKILRTVRKQSHGFKGLCTGERLCGEAKGYEWGKSRQGSYYDAIVFHAGHFLTQIKQGDANCGLQWCYLNSH